MTKEELRKVLKDRHWQALQHDVYCKSKGDAYIMGHLEADTLELRIPDLFSIHIPFTAFYLDRYGNLRFNLIEEDSQDEVEGSL